MKRLFTLLILFAPFAMVGQQAQVQNLIEAAFNKHNHILFGSNSRINCQPVKDYSYDWDSAGAVWDTVSRYDYNWISSNAMEGEGYGKMGGVWSKVEKIGIYGLTSIHNLEGFNGIDSFKIWSWDGSSWQPYLQIFNTRNGSGQLMSTSVYADLLGTGILNISKETFYYTGSGDLSYSLVETYNFMTMGLALSDSTVYTVDASGNILTSTTYSLDFTSMWEPSEKTTYTYNAQGNVQTIIFQYYNMGGWENDSQIAYTYYSSGMVESEVYSSWDGIAWVIGDRATRTYTTQGCPDEYLSEEYDGTAYHNESKTEFIYAPSTGVAEVQSIGVSVYPNPATDVLFISTDAADFTVEVITLSGQTVVAEENAQQINVADLPVGTYFVRVVAGEDVEVLRVVLQ